MATTNVDFVLITGGTAAVSGAATKATPFVVALDAVAARNIAGAVPGGKATGILGTTGLPVNTTGSRIGGFSDQGFAKNGAIHITTSGTTGVNPDLTNLATGATSTAGDTTFSTVNKITVKNCGSAAMTIAPGGSNPASLPKFTGTTPTLNLDPGAEVTFYSDAGVTVDSTHKIILITPTSGGDVVVAVGGS